MVQPKFNLFFRNREPKEKKDIIKANRFWPSFGCFLFPLKWLSVLFHRGNGITPRYKKQDNQEKHLLYNHPWKRHLKCLGRKLVSSFHFQIDVFTQGWINWSNLRWKLPTHPPDPNSYNKNSGAEAVFLQQFFKSTKRPSPPSPF